MSAAKNADVLVAGAGFAGIIAAISAAEAGADVCLVSAGQICSGSSFYPGTWGFGLVGPENKADEKELADTIMEVGCGVADRRLVEVFVSHISDSIAYLENMGVSLKTAANPTEREFIPCFDHKTRSWHGLVKEQARPVFLKRLEELGVTLLPYTQITELIQEEPGTGRVLGATAVCTRKGKQEIFSISAGAVVLASGGLGGLFQYHLNPDDVKSTGHYLAMEAGAEVVNLEFLQMMPGFLSPAYGTVFNEKIFRYTCSAAYGGWDPDQRKRLLELRSGHGPYTSRLDSRLVDEAIMQAWDQNRDGVLIRYEDVLKDHQPEFVKTYFQWLEKEKGVTIEDPVRIGLFAHASNGGIYINEHGETKVPGLYACGEVTGGMHGADRLGGLSTANALVFGRIAGGRAAEDGKRNRHMAAAAAARCFSGRVRPADAEPAVQTGGLAEPAAPAGKTAEQARLVRKELQSRMTACGMILRNKERSREMLDWLRRTAVQWNYDTDPFSCVEDYLETSVLYAELMTAVCFMEAVMLREESRGAHHRTDFPDQNEAMTHMIAYSCSRRETRHKWI